LVIKSNSLWPPTERALMAGLVDEGSLAKLADLISAIVIDQMT
jgi:hypothetical protein